MTNQWTQCTQGAAIQGTSGEGRPADDGRMKATLTRQQIKKLLFSLAQEIRAAGDRVELEICRDLSDLWTDHDVPQILREQLEIIWQSSRCANGALVRMALELVANTIEG